jgi:hypothetical protein
MQIVEDTIYEESDMIEDYLYFIKLVPHVFIDKLANEDYKGYSYSLNHNSKSADSTATPVVVLILDFAPINMVITLEHRSTLTEFLVNLCAIVGGVFVVFGLINKFLLAITGQAK